MSSLPFGQPTPYIHFRMGLPSAEVAYLALDPRIRRSYAQYELASRIFFVQLLVNNWPGVVLEGVKALDKGERHGVYVRADIRVLTPFGPVTLYPNVLRASARLFVPVL